MRYFIQRSTIRKCFNWISKFAFLAVTLVGTTAQAQFTGGDGSPGDPYQIETPAQLNEIRNDLGAHYILIDDIDLSTATGDASGAYWNSGEGWEPIGDRDNEFLGNLDGNGHTISGLTIDRNGGRQGLFSSLGENSKIANVHLADVNISANNAIGALTAIARGTIKKCTAAGMVYGSISVGGLVGEMRATASITDSFADVDITGPGDWKGGLVGTALPTHSPAIIERSYATGDVEGDQYIGGLIGRLGGVAVSESYATGNVAATGNDSFAGGLVGGDGEVNYGGKITDSYATGSVTGNRYIGGLVGFFLGDFIDNSYATGYVNDDTNSGGFAGYISSSTTVTNGFWNTDSGSQDNGLGTGLDNEEMRQQASFTGFDFTDTWQIDEGIAFPVLQNNEQVPPPGFVPVIDAPANGAARVSLIPTLQWLNEYETDSYDLQISTDSGFNMLVEDVTGITETQYTLSGDLSVGAIYYWRVRAAGDFGQTDWVSATFRTAPSPNGIGTEADPWEIATAAQLYAIRYYIGDHYEQTANIDLTTATGNASGAYWNGGKGWDPIELLIGTLNGNGHIISGMFVNRPGEDDIGLFAIIEGKISNVALRDVTILDGDDSVGGLSGWCESACEITNSFVTGSITASTGFAHGGLTGNNESSASIMDSYSTVSVNGDNQVGGLVGKNIGTITNSYAIGEVKGNDYVGGFIGENYGTITTSHWNIDTSEKTAGVGSGFASGVTGLTDYEMRQQASFTGFDFTDTWQIKSGLNTSYPYLQEITYDEPGTEPEVNPIPGLDGFIPDENNILYVDKNVDTEASSYSGEGNSWGNAIPELREALNWAQDWDAEEEESELQIWVADGLYTPVDPEDDANVTEDERLATFQLVDGVEVYGGFAGGEANLSDRQWKTHTTILSGDIDNNDEEFDPSTDGENIPDHMAGDNSFHVVTGNGTGDTALLDGFKIMGGFADGSEFKRGGGIQINEGSPTLENVTITANYAEILGGGMNVENASPTLKNVSFISNFVQVGGGGGMFVSAGSSTPILINVSFIKNYHEAPPGVDSGGGGIANDGNLTIINSEFIDNHTNTVGGGIFSYEGDLTILNTRFVSNETTVLGGAMFLRSENNVSLENVIMWDNRMSGITDEPFSSIFIPHGAKLTISNSLIANSGGSSNWDGYFRTDDGGNLDEDPQFADPDNGDYTLLDTSPVINAGDPETDLSLFSGGPGNPIDLAGNPRVFDGETYIIDMGAYEYQGEPVTVPEQIVLDSPSNETANVGLTPEFSWESLDDADEYHLQVSGDDEFGSTVIDESELEDTTFEPSGDLNNLTTYYWRVRASNAAGSGEWSEVFSFTTLPESSEVVILTDPSDEAEDVPLKPQFEWNPADGADSYDLQVSENDAFSSTVIDEDGISETDYQTTDNLDFSTTYYWRVRGVNAGGPGAWSETFSFTTQDQPEAADNRILMANTESYTFTPTDFGTADNSFTVVMDDLPGGFNGTLELNGNPVSTDDEISVADINNGDLTYTPLAGIYGYGFDSFEFSIKDAAGNTSEDSYTLSLDVAVTSFDLDYDGEGWRLLSSPVDGETVGDFFGPIWTQGFAGSDSPGADFSNIYTLNQSEYQWEPVGSDESELNAGDAVIAYVYGDDDNNGTDDGFPKTLSSSTTNWPDLDGSYDETLAYDPDQQTTGDSFYLWGNPYPIAIDLCQTRTDEIAENVYYWDSSAGGGNGDYVNLSCAADDVEISPFQSVWLRITDAGNDFEIPIDAYMDGTTSGYFKQNQSEDQFLITMNLTSQDQQEEVFSTSTRLLFDEEASVGSDLIDAPKLSSSELATRYLSLYSLDENDNSYGLQARPMDVGENIRIPLDIHTTESGRFILDWILPESHVFSGNYFLRDNTTGEVMELREGSDYRFEITGQDAIQTKEAEATHPMSEIAKFGSIALNTHRMNSGGTPRFELLIAASGVDGLTELGATPDEFTLAQNYPNPFNPTTVIQYQLPTSSQVRLEVYDMLGRNVATLVNEQVAAGRHTVNFDASNLSSGVYLYRLVAGSQIMTRKLTILK